MYTTDHFIIVYPIPNYQTLSYATPQCVGNLYNFYISHIKVVLVAYASDIVQLEQASVQYTEQIKLVTSSSLSICRLNDSIL